MPQEFEMHVLKRNTMHPAQRRWDATEREIDAKVKARGGPGFRFSQERIDHFESLWRKAYDDGLYSGGVTRQDAGYYFAREVEAVQAEILMVENAETKGANGMLFDIDTFGGEWARSIVQREHEGIGRARFGGHASTDAPMVNVIAREAERPVRPIDAAYDYDVKDIALGSVTGQPLDRSKGEFAKLAMLQELDDVIAQGHQVLGGGGVVGNTSIPTTTLPNGNWIAGAKTPDQIVADFLKMQTDADADTGGRAKLTHAVMPPAYLSHIRGLRLGDTEASVRKYIEDKCGLVLEDWYALKDAGSSGEDILFAYRKEKSVIKVALPVPFKQLPPQPKNRAWIVNCYMETAGLIVDKPLYCRRANLTAS